MRTSDEPADADGPWLVACLCAAWCTGCRDYRATFAAVAAEQRDEDVRFVWVDIEDESDALAPFDLDIEDFPTVLIARGDELRFLGTLLPHAATLERTLQAARDGTLARAQPALAGLPARVRAIGQAVA